MMKRTTTILTIILAGLIVMLAGCQEPLDFNAKKGESIRVKVSSRRGATTKTEYSGAIYTDNGARYERIDWKHGDSLRLYSTDASLVATSDGKEFFDYTIDRVSTDGNRYSEATLYIPENHQNYGLIWVNDPTNLVTVYGIYPPRDAVKNGGLITGFVDLSIPAPSLSWSGGVGTPTNTTADSYMKHAYMVSRPSKFTKDATGSEAWKEKPYVDLDFYPIFNAFYIVLGSQRNEIALNSLTLSNGQNDEPLTGNYKFSYKLRNGQDYTFDATGPTYESIDHTGNLSHSVTVNFPAGTKISPTDSVKFTILTLPPAKSANITNLTLTVNYGNNQTKSLKLNNQVSSSNPEGTPIQFPAFHKARITGLALEGGSKWQLIIDDQVLPWIKDEQTTSFKSNIGIKNPLFSGYVETDPKYIYEDINNSILRQTTPYYNDQPVSPDGYYYLNNGEYTHNGYYIRLTTKIEGEDDPCITYQFTPTMPIGGYWQLSPEAVEGSLDYFRITVDDGINGESTRLQGQVMGVPVTIYIRPTAEYLALDNAPVCSCIIKCNMSPSANWDPLYSADSEFQSAHTDGTFSYNKFRIAK